MLWFKVAASTIILSVGKSMCTFTILVGVLLIASMIMIHAALCRRRNLVPIEVTLILLHHASAASVTFWIIIRSYSHRIVLEVRP